MKNEVKTFRLFVRPDEKNPQIPDKKSQEIADKIRELNKNTSTPLLESNAEADLVIAIGGDGTFIEAVTQTNFSKKTIYTGIHTGTLGFLQDLCENDVLSLIQYIKFEEELKTRKVYTASIKVYLKDDNILHFSALNDLLVGGKDFAKLHFEEYIDNKFLQNITGSAMVVATNTGDTALSASAYGAINLSYERQLVCTPILAIPNSAYQRFMPNPITGSKISLCISPSNNIRIIIDGKAKDIDSSKIVKVEVTMPRSSYINKLDIMNYSKVRVVREKILGY